MRCDRCQRELADDEPIFRISNAWGSYGRGKGGSICGKCIEQGFYWQKHRAPKPCCQCGRPVILTVRGPQPKYVVCGAACRQAAYGAAARRRRRSPSRPCTICGEHFIPKRRDAVHCSPACKQKAYRARLQRRAAAE